MSGILLASDEKSTVAILTKLLKTEGYKVITEDVLSKALELVKTEKFDLIISCAGGGWDPDAKLAHTAKAEAASTPLIVIADNSKPELVARIGQIQPFACIGKPLKIDKLLSTIQKAIDFGGTQAAAEVNLNLQLEKCYQFQDIVAESPAMKSVCDMVSRVAGTDVTVLVIGEKGTGKSVLARIVHANSKRKDKPFVVVDCANAGIANFLFGEAGKAGALENANGATLFLDQIEKLPIKLQEELYKVMSEKKIKSVQTGKEEPFNARMIVSAGADLESLTKNGSFKQDLYRIIRVILVKIPPLRDRKDDVIPTIRQVLRTKLSGVAILPVLDQEVMDLFAKYPWPGNIHEMELVIGHALKSSSGKNRITLADLPPQLKKAM